MRKSKEEYDRTQRARIMATKEQRAREKRLGLTGMRRLAFVRDLIYGRGYTLQSLADHVTMTPQGLSWVFNVQDDCSLDILQEILAAVGVSCKVALKCRDSLGHDMSIPSRRYRFDGNVAVPKLIQTYPRIIAECSKEARMHFLAEFIVSTQIPFSLFCKQSGYPNRSYYNFFKADKIKVSFICQIAERFDADVIWTLNEICK